MWMAIQAVFAIVSGLIFMGFLLGGISSQNHYEWPGDERGEPFRGKDA